MASGASTKLTGQIGENLVSAILGVHGYYASPYSGNVPGFDVTAVNSNSLKSFPIQVKTSTKGSLVQSSIEKWCEHSISSDNVQTLGAPLDLRHPEMIWIIVRLGSDSIRDVRFFICTELDIQIKIVGRYRAFMERHNYRRPGGGGSRQAILNLEDLAEYEENWDALPEYA